MSRDFLIKVLSSKDFQTIDRDALIRHFGTWSLSREYDLIFEVLGSFIAGEDAVLFQWAHIHSSRTFRECQPRRCP